jgi:hypothetical protein
MNKERPPGLRKKTIETVLTRKFNPWAHSIDDPYAQRLVMENSFISGGCIASMLLGEPVNDFDIYFTNKETAKAVATYYIDKFNAANEADVRLIDGAIHGNATGYRRLNLTEDRLKIIVPGYVQTEQGSILDEDIDEEATLEKTAAPERRYSVAEIIENKQLSNPEWITGLAAAVKDKYRPICITSNTITLSDDIQIIIRFHGLPGIVHQNFDFVHCTNYWWNGGLNLNEAALQAILAKELVYIGSKYPVASLIRLRKFLSRGWRIHAGQILKIAYQISQLDLNNMEVLEDQLIGVDIAIFASLLEEMSSLRSLSATTNPFVTYPYISDLIDKAFG